MIRAYHVLMMFRDYGLITLKPDPKGSPPLTLDCKEWCVMFYLCFCIHFKMSKLLAYHFRNKRKSCSELAKRCGW